MHKSIPTSPFHPIVFHRVYVHKITTRIYIYFYPTRSGSSYVTHFHFK